MYEIQTDEETGELYVKVDGWPEDRATHEAIEQGQKELESLSEAERETIRDDSTDVAPEAAALFGGDDDTTHTAAD